MVQARFFLLVLAAALKPQLFSFADASEVGVSYGRVAKPNSLPDPGPATQLLKDNGVTMVRIYDADAGVLSSLANTGIKVMVMLPNEDLARAASDRGYAQQWVRSNVAAYHPRTQINGVAVGNEVFDQRPDLTSRLLQAMTNVQDALAQLHLDGDIKVSTPIAFSAVTDTTPPSRARFVNEATMRPMLQFLKRTGSYLTLNIYPFWAYYNQPDDITRDFALGNPNNGLVYEDKGPRYYSLLDAERDAAHAAMDRLVPGVSLKLTETGHPSRGTPHQGGKGGRGRNRGRRLQDADVFSVANAHDYINNVINRVKSGNTGTPLRPDADMDVYIFALFNEDAKGDGPDDIEQNFGLFYPNMQKVYEFSFPGSKSPAGSWCVANAGVGDARLQAALDYACGHGADCGAIQPGASCFLPDTKLAHATYAFNSYYQRNGRASQACDFAGAAHVVNQAPNMCGAQSSWCVANAGVGDGRLQVALDYACSHGADCSAIQPGASCFQPDTKLAHATYAFNSYFQRNGRASQACDFAGAAHVVDQAPNMCSARTSWCVANAGVGDGRLQAALDYACSHGADCSDIQPGAACFQPDTKVAHASHAFNSYYQRQHRASGSCDFAGAASVVYDEPRIGNCALPSRA